ncbi:protein kinase [Clostridiaceae bacterium M8S5]|nr:protein kinase [Clostridiaceae bacterium M8S5]
MRKIVGKWNKKEYTILKKIGSGGIGCIYKVKDENDKVYALKISENMYSISREFDAMQKLKDMDFVPKVYDMDDFISKDKTYFFLVMDYIQGQSLREYVYKKKLKEEDLLSIWLLLIKELNSMYQKNYMYYDIKPDNILIDEINSKIIFIDFGSVVSSNSGVVEFTPTYNINSWLNNEKITREQSLIFSMAILIIFLLTNKELNPIKSKFPDLINLIKKTNVSNELKTLLINCLKGKHKNIKIFEKKLKIVYNSLINNKYKNFRIVDILFTTSISFFLILMLYSMLK